MDDIFSLHASLIYLLPKLIYTTAFLNTYFLIFRLWIIRSPLPSSQPSNTPSPMILSPVYALFQTLYLFLFWYSGLANEPWILVLQIPPFHLWASSICSVWIDTARKREFEKRVEKQSPSDEVETQPPSTAPSTHDLSIPWPQKLLPFLLFPMQTAAASDAALTLLAGRSCSTTGVAWLEENSIRTYLITFAISIYLGCNIYSDLLLSRKFHIPLFLLPSAKEILFNLASILVLRANIAYITHIAPIGKSFPLWSLVHLTCGGPRGEPPSGAEKTGVWGDWKVQLAAKVVSIGAAFVAGWYLEKAKDDARIPGERDGENERHVEKGGANGSGGEKKEDGI